MQNKKPDNQWRVKRKQSDDDLRPVLALLSMKNNQAGICPDDNDLAAFADGLLSGEKRNLIYSHLNECDTCRKVVHHVCSAADECEHGVPGHENLDPVPRKIVKFMARHMKSTAGISMALAACLWFVWFISLSDDLNRMISNTYAFIPQKDAERFSSFSSRGETPTDEKQSEAYSAYRQGLETGMAGLKNSSVIIQGKPFNNPQLSLLYSTGQWVVSLQCACTGKDNVGMPDFWSAQKAISKKIHKEITRTEKPTKDILALNEMNGAISEAINHILKEDAKVDGCEDISLAIGTMENSLKETSL